MQRQYQSLQIDEDRIRAEKNNEIASLKETIAEVVQENLEMGKNLGIACGVGDRYEIDLL